MERFFKLVRGNWFVIRRETVKKLRMLVNDLFCTS